MSYDTLKLILWGLLCIPILAIGVWTLSNLLQESLEVEKGKKRKKTKAQLRKEKKDAEAKLAEIELQRQRRKEFDEQYKRTHGI